MHTKDTQNISDFYILIIILCLKDYPIVLLRLLLSKKYYYYDYHILYWKFSETMQLKQKNRTAWCTIREMYHVAVYTKIVLSFLYSSLLFYDFACLQYFVLLFIHECTYTPNKIFFFCCFWHFNWVYDSLHCYCLIVCSTWLAHAYRETFQIKFKKKKC